MQISVAAAPVPAVQPTRPILRDAISRDWIASKRVDGDTLGDIASRSLQFQLAGEGPLSTRDLVPQTAAARKLLDGPAGERLEQALRGMLATTDPHQARASVGGISLARGTRDFAVNSALMYLENGDVAGWSPRRSKASQDALDGALDGGRQVAKLAVAQATGWINLGPTASRQLLRLVSGDRPAKGDALMGAWLSSLGAHEPHHRVSPLRNDDVVRPEYRQDPLPPDLARKARDNPFVTLKPLNWIEEGTGEVLATWAGAPQRTASRMGLPSTGALPEPRLPEDPAVLDALVAAQSRGGRLLPPERAAMDAWIADTYGIKARSDAERAQLVANVATGMVSYPVHVSGMQRLLGLAGLDAANPDDFAAASALLQDAALNRVPGRIADAIIAARGLEPSRREPLRAQIRDAGEHVMTDPAAFDAAISTIAASVLRPPG